MRVSLARALFIEPDGPPQTSNPTPNPYPYPYPYP